MSQGIRLLRGTRPQHTANSSIFYNGEITAVTTANGVCTGELRIHNENFLGGVPVGNMALTQTVLEGGRISHLREARTIVDLGTINTRDLILQKGTDQLVIPANNVGIFKSDELTPIVEETNTKVTIKNVSIDLSNDTGAIIVPKGTTAQRPATPTAGMIRYNTELDQYELYDETTTAWGKLGDQPPTISSISPATTETVTGTTEFTVTGINFESAGMTTQFVSTVDSTVVNRTAFVFDNSGQIRITFDNTDFDATKEPYNLVITKSSGLSATKLNALYVDEAPVWTLTSTNIATILPQAITNVNIDLPTATDPDGDTVTYSASNLPSGLSIDANTGDLSGSVPAANTEIEYTVTVNALSTGNDPGATQRTTTRQPTIIVKPVIENSLMFDGSSYLTGNFSTNTDATSATYSFWVRRSKLGVDEHLFGHRDTSNNNNRIYINFNTSDQIQVICYNSSATIIGNVKPTAVLRDTSAWYHFVLVFDINGSNSAKIRWHINGEVITDLATSTYPSTSVRVINSGHSTIGANPYGDGSTFNNKFNGYLANIQFIDGQALTPLSFGESINGIWLPKVYNPTGNALTDYGTNGFHLTFAPSTISGTTVQDISGRGNDWTANGF